MLKKFTRLDIYETIHETIAIYTVNNESDYNNPNITLITRSEWENQGGE